MEQPGAEVRPLGVAAKVSDETRLRVIAALSSGEGLFSPGSLDGVPQREVLAIAYAVITAGKVPFQIEEKTANADERKRKISLEHTRKLLGVKLQPRFEANPERHKKIKWDRVKRSLEMDAEALWSINRMEEAGHAPDVYYADEEGFDIGTCCLESPERDRNCVYDEEAAKFLRENGCKNEIFNGSAVAMAKDMGITLITERQWRHLQSHKDAKYDANTRSWLLKEAGIGEDGTAIVGIRYGCNIDVTTQYSVVDHDPNLAWRGSLRVKWAA